MRFFLLIFVFVTPCLSQASENTFIREYTYQASDLDSRVTARKHTLDLIKASVLDEIISYTHNANTLKQTQAGKQFHSRFIQHTTSSTAGFLKARILEENWNGFEMYIKAELKADPVKIRDELKNNLALNVTKNSKPKQVKNLPIEPGAQSMPVMITTPDYSGYVRAAEFVQVIVLLQPLKITMNEYYMMNGEWPSSLKKIRLTPEEMTDGQYLDKVRLGKGGLIFAYLSNKFGKDRYISLQPVSIMGGMNTRWDCNTNLNIKEIKNQFAQKCTQKKHMSYN